MKIEHVIYITYIYITSQPISPIRIALSETINKLWNLLLTQTTPQPCDKYNNNKYVQKVRKLQYKRDEKIMEKIIKETKLNHIGY